MDESKVVRSKMHALDLASLYPNLSSEELEEAKENLRQYVAVALRVFERLESDPKAMERFEALLDSRGQGCRTSR